jgi:hypothetical protein
VNYKGKSQKNTGRESQITLVESHKKIWVKAKLSYYFETILIIFDNLASVTMASVAMDIFVDLDSVSLHPLHSSRVLGLIKPLLSIWSASTRATMASATGTIRGGIMGSCLPLIAISVFSRVLRSTVC